MITNASMSTAATWTTSRTRIATATWWVASRAMSATVATWTAPWAWIYNFKGKWLAWNMFFIRSTWIRTWSAAATAAMRTWSECWWLWWLLIQIRFSTAEVSYLLNKTIKFLKWLFVFRNNFLIMIVALPNLSRTDGPGGGGCDGIGCCLLDSYFDVGYETVWCDDDDDAPYCDCFGIFNASSWSSSSFGKAYLETADSFLLLCKRKKNGTFD